MADPQLGSVRAGARRLLFTNFMSYALSTPTISHLEDGNALKM